MGRFKSLGQAQRFLSIHGQTAAIFRPKRHRLSAACYRQARAEAFSLWSVYAEEMAAYWPAGLGLASREQRYKALVAPVTNVVSTDRATK